MKGSLFCGFMQKIKRLRRKEIKVIFEGILDSFGIEIDRGFLFYETPKGKVYMVNSSFLDFDIEGLRIDKGGFYFCERKGNFIRLSMQAAQMIGQKAKEEKVELLNVVELSEEEYLKYMKGEDVKTVKSDAKSVLLSFRGEVFCPAQIKEKYILNYVPKAYRGTVIV